MVGKQFVPFLIDIESVDPPTPQITKTKTANGPGNPCDGADIVYIFPVTALPSPKTENDFTNAHYRNSGPAPLNSEGDEPIDPAESGQLAGHVPLSDEGGVVASSL